VEGGRFRLKKGPSLFLESGFWNIQILTDLLGQEIVNFCMPRNSRSSVFGNISPPGVVAALAD
jgi:hypothetical protein